MGNLYFDNIGDKKAYSDEDVLKDLRALVSLGQREGTPIEYKKDVSAKDNWPEGAAAFANTFGGLIIFGVDAQQGKPILLTGFDPRGVETETKLVSILLSRIQPRPDFQIRVLNLDTDKTKEIAILRISEGITPPYLHSKLGEHRIYIRAGSQKAEADYLQLNSLFERRKRVDSESAASVAELSGSKSPLQVYDPVGTNQISRHLYRFILAPDDVRAARRLTLAIERDFEQVVRTFVGDGKAMPSLRTRTTTCFRYSPTNPLEQRFAVSSSGSIGFVSHACLKTDKGLFFAPSWFCRDLTNFLTMAALFYERRRFYGSCFLDVNLALLDGANVYLKQPPFDTEDFFQPSLDAIQAGQFGVQLRVFQQTLTTELTQEHLGAVLNDLARDLGSVLNPNFEKITHDFVNDRCNLLRNA